MAIALMIINRSNVHYFIPETAVRTDIQYVQLRRQWKTTQRKVFAKQMLEWKREEVNHEDEACFSQKTRDIESKERQNK